MGVYSLPRIIARPSDKVTTVWIMGQAGAAGLVAALYISHISKLKGDYAAGTIQGWLANSFFRPGHDNPFSSQLLAPAASFSMFSASSRLETSPTWHSLWGSFTLEERASCYGARRDFASIRTSSGFAIRCGSGSGNCQNLSLWGTRHSAFLIMFAVAGVSLVMARSVKENLRWGIAAAILIVAVCNALGKPHRPYILRGDQSRMQMTRATEFIHSQIPQSDLIFVDYQTRLLLGYYICRNNRSRLLLLLAALSVSMRQPRGGRCGS